MIVTMSFLLIIQVLSTQSDTPWPRTFVQYDGKLYEAGTCMAKDTLSPTNRGRLALRDVETNRILLNVSQSELPKLSYYRPHWAYADGKLIFASQMPSSRRDDLLPCGKRFNLKDIPLLATFTELQEDGAEPYFQDQRLYWNWGLRRLRGIQSNIRSTLWYTFPDQFVLRDVGKVPFDYSAITGGTGCFYKKEGKRIAVYYTGPLDPYPFIKHANADDLWIFKWSLPLNVTSDFYVYQTTRNALCLLDSDRQLHYIAPIGGGAMVKKVQKLDYPVKIVYSGKTIDIIAQNTSFHLDAAGQLSSPAKTVWPKK